VPPSVTRRPGTADAVVLGLAATLGAGVFGVWGPAAGAAGAWLPMAVVVAGRVQAGGETAHAGELLLFAHDGERMELIADEDSHVLILAGEPIDEPVVQYGPFVMNSLDEIRQAVTDVNAGRFGPIPD